MTPQGSVKGSCSMPDDAKDKDCFVLLLIYPPSVVKKKNIWAMSALLENVLVSMKMTRNNKKASSLFFFLFII